MVEPDPNVEFLCNSLKKRYKQRDHDSASSRTEVTFLLTQSSSLLAIAGRMALTATCANPIMSVVRWNDHILGGPTLLGGFCLYRS